MITEIKDCGCCGSDNLFWSTHYETKSGVPDGRLRMSEVSCVFVLGCEYCSETLLVMTADELAEKLSSIHHQ